MPLFGKFDYQIVRFQNESNKVALDLGDVQFWSEIIFVISNRTRAARSSDFEIRRFQTKLPSTQFNYHY